MLFSSYYIESCWKVQPDENCISVIVWEFKLEINFTKKIVVFLYMNIDQSQRKIKKPVPFLKALKKIKTIIINLTKNLKDLYLKTLKHTER